MIRDTLRACGCIVEDMSDVGRGVPDLLVRTKRGTVYIVDVKNPFQPLGKQRLTPAQELVAARWGDSFRVLKTYADAIALART